MGLRPAIVMRGYGEDEVRLHRRLEPRDARHRDPPPHRRGAGRPSASGGGWPCSTTASSTARCAATSTSFFSRPCIPSLPASSPGDRSASRSARCGGAGLILVTSKGEDERKAAARLAAELRRAPGLPPVDLCHLEAGEWERLDGSRGSPPRRPGPGRRVGCRAALIPRPRPGASRRSAGGASLRRSSPLHAGRCRAHREACGRPRVVTTEKDAVKLGGLRGNSFRPSGCFPSSPSPGAG